MQCFVHSSMQHTTEGGLAKAAWSLATCRPLFVSQYATRQSPQKPPCLARLWTGMWVRLDMGKAAHAIFSQFYRRPDPNRSDPVPICHGVESCGALAWGSVQPRGRHLPNPALPSQARTNKARGAGREKASDGMEEKARCSGLCRWFPWEGSKRASSPPSKEECFLSS